MYKKTEITRYKKGTNAWLDAILDDEKVFICQGDKGRRPIIADSKDEAREKYEAIPKKNY